MSLIRMIKLGARVAEWAAPRVQEWQRTRSFNEDEGWRNLEAGNPGEAEKHFLLVFEESRPSPAKRLQLTLGIAEAQRRQGKLAEASGTARKALAMATESKNHDSRQEALQVLIDLHLDQGQAAQALELTQEIIHRENARPRPDEELLVKHHRKFGAVLLQNGFLEKSVDSYRLSVKLAELAFGLDHVEMADSLTGLGSVLRQTGKFEEAQNCLRTALEVHRAVRGPESREVTEDLNQLAASLEEAGDIQGAVGEYEKALSLSERQIGGNPEDTIMVRVHLAALYLQTNRVSAARELLLHAIRVLEKRADDRYVLALKVLAFAEEYSNHPEEAQRLRQKAIAVVDRREGRAAPGALDEPKADAAPMVVLPSAPKPTAAPPAAPAPVSIFVVTPGVVTPGVVTPGVVTPGVVTPGAITPGVPQPAEPGGAQRIAYTTHAQLTAHAQPAAESIAQPSSDFASFYKKPGEQSAAPVSAASAAPISVPEVWPAKPLLPERQKPEQEPAASAPLSIWKADAPPPAAQPPLAQPSQSIQVPAGMQVVLMSGDQLIGAQEATRLSQAAQPSSDFADFYKTHPAAPAPSRPSAKRAAPVLSGEIGFAPVVHAAEPITPSGQVTTASQVTVASNVAEPEAFSAAHTAAPGVTADSSEEHVETTGIETDSEKSTNPQAERTEAPVLESAFVEASPAPAEGKAGEQNPHPTPEQPSEQTRPPHGQDSRQQPASGQAAAGISRDVPAPAPLAQPVSLASPDAAKPPLFAPWDSSPQPQSVPSIQVPLKTAPSSAIETPSPVLRTMMPLQKPEQAPPPARDAKPGADSAAIAPNFADGPVRLPHNDPALLPSKTVADSDAASSHRELQPPVSLHPAPPAESRAANVPLNGSDSTPAVSSIQPALPELTGFPQPYAVNHSSPFPLQAATSWRFDLRTPRVPAAGSSAVTNSPVPFIPAGPVHLLKNADAATPEALTLQLAPAVALTKFATLAPEPAVPQGAVLVMQRSFSGQATGLPFRMISYASGQSDSIGSGQVGTLQNGVAGWPGSLPEGELQPVAMEGLCTPADSPALRGSPLGSLLQTDPRHLAFRHRDTRVRYPRPISQKLSDDDQTHDDDRCDAVAFATLDEPEARADEKMLGANGLLHLAILSPSRDQTVSPPNHPANETAGSAGIFSAEEFGEDLPQLTLGGGGSSDDLPDPFGF